MWYHFLRLLILDPCSLDLSLISSRYLSTAMQLQTIDGRALRQLWQELTRQTLVLSVAESLDLIGSCEAILNEING